jgi:L-2-hydroxycarboxylate dehydrogenase (NAD+)
MSFFFQAIHPEALGLGTFKDRKAMEKNVAAVLKDILCEGNEKCMLPGQIEAEAAVKSKKFGGLLFTENEIKGFQHEFEGAGIAWDPSKLKTVEL